MASNKDRVNHPTRTNLRSAQLETNRDSNNKVDPMLMANNKVRVNLDKDPSTRLLSVQHPSNSSISQGKEDSKDLM